MKRTKSICFLALHWILYLLEGAFFYFLFRFTQSYLLFLAVVLIVLLPIISLFLTRYAVRNCKLTVVQSHTLFDKNTPFSISIMIYTPWRIPILNGVLHYELVHYWHPVTNTSKQLVFGTGCSRTLPIQLHLSSRYSGRIYLSINELEVWDYLKLFHFTRSLSKENAAENYKGEFVILPNKHPMDSLSEKPAGVNSSDAEQTTELKGQDASEVADYRPYIPGDRMQMVHWKLSIRQQQLIVKEQSDSASPLPLVFLDLVADNEDTFDVLLDTLASLAHEFLLASQPFMLVWITAGAMECSTQLINNSNEWENAFLTLSYCKRYKTPRILQAYYGTTSIPDSYIYVNDLTEGGELHA